MYFLFIYSFIPSFLHRVLRPHAWHWEFNGEENTAKAHIFRELTSRKDWHEPNHGASEQIVTNRSYAVEARRLPQHGEGGWEMEDSFRAYFSL